MRSPNSSYRNSFQERNFIHKTDTSSKSSFFRGQNQARQHFLLNLKALAYPTDRDVQPTEKQPTFTVEKSIIGNNIQ